MTWWGGCCMLSLYFVFGLKLLYSFTQLDIHGFQLAFQLCVLPIPNCLMFKQCKLFKPPPALLFWSSSLIRLELFFGALYSSLADLVHLPPTLRLQCRFLSLAFAPILLNWKNNACEIGANWVQVLQFPFSCMVIYLLWRYIYILVIASMAIMHKLFGD